MYIPTKNGFTLIEALVVIAIIVIVTAATIPLYGRWQTASILGSTKTEIVQNIRTAQIKAKSGLNNSDFGAYFLTTSYTIYEGSTYITRDQSQDAIFSLPGNISLSGLSEVNFTKKTGIPSVVGTLLINNLASGEKVSIDINSEGLIE